MWKGWADQRPSHVPPSPSTDHHGSRSRSYEVHGSRLRNQGGAAASQARQLAAGVRRAFGGAGLRNRPGVEWSWVVLPSAPGVRGRGELRRGRRPFSRPSLPEGRFLNEYAVPLATYGYAPAEPPPGSWRFPPDCSPRVGVAPSVACCRFSSVESPPLSPVRPPELPLSRFSHSCLVN